jgi:nucleotide-binding universal stress UspA family protein
MTFMVPYDGSNLARAALTRAVEYADALGESVTALSVLPAEDAAYARGKRWIGPDEEYDPDEVADWLESEVATVGEAAGFRAEVVEGPTPQAVASAVKRVAGEVHPSVVFVGSENAGEVVTPVTSVGGEVAADAEYDVHVVRHWSPTLVQAVETDPELYPEDRGAAR